MTRPRRLAAAAALLVLLLFAGRWVAGMLADRWWAMALSPAAADFLTQTYILRFVLKIGGILVASAWFIGHLLVVHRAVGSVQIRRHVANIEIREALTPRTLLLAALASGTVLGFVTGGEVSDWWRQVVLAWHGVSYGLVDPLLERDLGLYVAYLPLWREAHSFFFLLVILALGIVFGLYIVVGAVKWLEGRPAINDHARRHVGWLLLAFAAVLAWGYLLEPYEVVAGLAGGPPGQGWRATVVIAPVLAGFALAAGGLSAVWAVQPRHTLAAAAWIVLFLASLVGHWILPAMLDTGAAGAVDMQAVKLNRLAYGLDGLQVERVRATDSIGRPSRPALWSAPAIAHIAGDSLSLLWADPALVPISGTLRPSWLILRPAPVEERFAVWAVADDRAGIGGTPLFYRANDTVAYSAPASLLEVSDRIVRPDAPRYRIGGDSTAGVTVGSPPKRMALAWALQAGGLLSGLPPRARIDWHLSPSIRLTQLAPFAEWGTPVLRILDGNLVWIADGYVVSPVFPVAHRARWRGRTVGAVRAGFVGVVDAETGMTEIYLRPGAGALADAWAAVSEGFVQPAKNMSAALREMLPYPAELFRLQAQELERQPWRAGTLAGRPAPGADPTEPPRTDVQWDGPSGGPAHTVVYDQPGARTVASALIGTRVQGKDVLRLIRLDSLASLPTRTVLETRWARFPSYDLLNDSVQEDGGRLERGPVRYEMVESGLVAYQTHIARRAPERPAIVWVSVAAAHDRLGAGRAFQPAWNNLLGGAAPEPAGASERDRLSEARAWLRRADSALRGGNWTAFGRAWHELQRILGGGAAADTAPKR